jgi:hypothetical protein
MNYKMRNKQDITVNQSVVPARHALQALQGRYFINRRCSVAQPTAVE